MAIDFFNEGEGDEGIKREIAFQTVAAVRDTLGLATKAQRPPTYEDSLKVIHDLDKELYEDFTRILAAKNDNEIVKLFKEKAQLESLKGAKVNPADLIEKEINELKSLLNLGHESKESTQYVKLRIALLTASIEKLKPRNVNENGILVRDFANVDRTDLFGEVKFRDHKFIDYELKGKNFLRLRLLHPDQGERLTGADLVYEQYDVTEEKVRFVFLQYKTWLNNGISINQQTNLLPQLKKMQSFLCDKSLCNSELKNEMRDYRFPYCSGFLRPTDKLQHNLSKMVSSGFHIPVCRALNIFSENDKIEKKNIQNNSPNHYMFEKLFNLNLIGSRWISTNQLEETYHEKKVLEPDTNLKIYAREILNPQNTNNDFENDTDYF